MENELERLIREKEDLERRIMMLTDGKIIMDTVKLDMIKHNAANGGRWAVSYKYNYISQWGCHCVPKDSSKWVPIFSCANRDAAVAMIPKVIDELKALYEKATKREEQR